VSKVEKKTMTLNLPRDEMLTLEALAESMQMDKTSALRRAIKILNAMYAHEQQENRIFVYDKNGTRISEIVLI